MRLFQSICQIINQQWACQEDTALFHFSSSFSFHLSVYVCPLCESMCALDAGFTDICCLLWDYHKITKATFTLSSTLPSDFSVRSLSFYVDVGSHLYFKMTCAKRLCEHCWGPKLTRTRKLNWYKPCAHNNVICTATQQLNWWTSSKTAQLHHVPSTLEVPHLYIHHWLLSHSKIFHLL